jgi:hypothetical protein
MRRSVATPGAGGPVLNKQINNPYFQARRCLAFLAPRQNIFLLLICFAISAARASAEDDSIYFDSSASA